MLTARILTEEDIKEWHDEERRVFTNNVADCYELYRAGTGCIYSVVYNLVVYLGGNVLDPKEYLNQIRYTNQEIQSRIDEKNQLRSAVSLKTSSFQSDKVQESGTLNYDDKYMKFIEVAEEINDKIDNLVDLKLSVSNEIDRLDKSEHRILLRLRYINLQSFESIAVSMGYDIRQVHRLHGNALQAFSERVTKCHWMS